MQQVKEMFPMRLTLSVPTNHELHKANGEAFTGEQIYCRSERVVHDRPVWEHVEGGRWLYFYFSRTPRWLFTRREGSIGQGKGAICGTSEGLSPLGVTQWQWFSGGCEWIEDNAISITQH